MIMLSISTQTTRLNHSLAHASLTTHTVCRRTGGGKHAFCFVGAAGYLCIFALLACVLLMNEDMKTMRLSADTPLA
jgi:hypothetical protein